MTRLLLIGASCLAAVALTSSVASAQAVDRLGELVAGEQLVRLGYANESGALVQTLNEDGTVSGELRLSTTTSPVAPQRAQTKSFYVSMQSHQPGSATTERLVQLAHRISARDDGSLGFVRSPPAPGGPGPSRNVWIVALITGLAAGLLQLLRRSVIVWEFRLPHLLVALNQAAILGYLWLYWPGVSEQAPVIIAQIALAYAVDMLVMTALFRRWSAGLGPLPIVLSSNLFAWFGALGSIIVVFVAISSRALIRRGGRHVLNPSAVGLGVTLTLSYAFPASFPLQGVFSRLTIPPNMSELLLVLPLIPQLRFRIVLASVGAILGLLLGQATFGDIPGIAMPGTLILMTIFLTDPATQPTTPVGQLLFGILVGLGVAATTWAGAALGAPDDRLAKILPVPLCNALVPAFDAAGRRLDALLHDMLVLFGPRWNLLHIALWWLLVVPGITAQKASMFNGAFHWTYGTPLVVRDTDDVPRCENNPVFCQFFSFRQELALWLKHPPRGTAVVQR